MYFRYLFIVCNKYTIQMWDVFNGENWVHYIWEFSVLSLQLFCESETVLKNNICLKNGGKKLPQNIICNSEKIEKANSLSNKEIGK